MKNTKKCGNCGQSALKSTKLDYEASFDHDGRSYNFTVPGLQVLQCPLCNSIVLDDAANDRIGEEFRRHAGLLPPAEIRSRREALQLSQKELASYLDVSIFTLSRWETGAQIQQRAMDKLLRLFFDVQEVREYLGFPEQVIPLSTVPPMASQAK